MKTKLSRKDLERLISIPDILHFLLEAPAHILQNHKAEHLASFILSHIANKKCFDLKKMAYFINNPDFDCLKGVTGCDLNSINFLEQPEVWQDPNKSWQYLQENSFYQQVCKVKTKSLNRPDLDKAQFAHLHDICNQLQFESASFLTWPLKHDNQAVLIFEPNDHKDFSFKEALFAKIMPILGFCNF